MKTCSAKLFRAFAVGAALCVLVPVTAWAGRSDPVKIHVPSYVKKAMADPVRAKDQAKDAQRRPGAVLAFSKVKPGDTVIELVPGTGYWTRMFSQIVGKHGHVYAVVPREMAKAYPSSLKEVKAIAGNPHYGNVTVLQSPAARLRAPHKADLVFTAENMHDYNNQGLGHITPKALASEVLKVLKPGGIFLVNDHVAPAGAGLSDTSTLHRIDPALVKKQVTAAGFKFDGANDALRNPKDPHTIAIFKDSIRGHTDQFIYRFRKPGH